VPFPTRPPVFDQRMLSQRAIFTFDGPLDGGIPHPLADPFGSGLCDVVKRIDLAPSWREEAFRSLAAIGIGAETLFPGNGRDWQGDASPNEGRSPDRARRRTPPRVTITTKLSRAVRDRTFGILS
jgi:hypothetical protein